MTTGAPRELEECCATKSGVPTHPAGPHRGCVAKYRIPALWHCDIATTHARGDLQKVGGRCLSRTVPTSAQISLRGTDGTPRCSV